MDFALPVLRSKYNIGQKVWHRMWGAPKSLADIEENKEWIGIPCKIEQIILWNEYIKSDKPLDYLADKPMESNTWAFFYIISDAGGNKLKVDEYTLTSCCFSGFRFTQSRFFKD